MCSSDLRDDVEAGTPINERLRDGNVVDGGGADQRDGAHSRGGLGVVAGVKSDRALGPLEGPGGLDPGKPRTGGQGPLKSSPEPKTGCYSP